MGRRISGCLWPFVTGSFSFGIRRQRMSPVPAKVTPLVLRPINHHFVLCVGDARLEFHFVIEISFLLPCVQLSDERPIEICQGLRHFISFDALRKIILLHRRQHVLSRRHIQRWPNKNIIVTHCGIARLTAVGLALGHRWHDVRGTGDAILTALSEARSAGQDRVFRGPTARLLTIDLKTAVTIVECAALGACCTADACQADWVLLVHHPVTNGL